MPRIGKYIDSEKEICSCLMGGASEDGEREVIANEYDEISFWGAPKLDCARGCTAL